MELRGKRENLKEPLQHGTADFPVALYNNHFERQYDLLAPLHYHREFELLVITRGTVSIQIEKESYILHRGEGVFVNSGLLHMICSADQTDHGFIAIVFDYTLLCNESDKIFSSYIRPMMNQSLLLPVSLPGEICTQVEEICRIFEAAPFGYELSVKSSLLHILFRLMENARQTASPVQSARSNILKSVVDYMEVNYSNPISLQELAEHVHTSREYLCRIFHEMTDVSPIVYLNRYRIMQSTFMLVDSSRSISDIALSCGFNNSSYFNKLFMRHMGCTPSEYRKRSISF